MTLVNRGVVRRNSTGRGQFEHQRTQLEPYWLLALLTLVVWSSNHTQGKGFGNDSCQPSRCAGVCHQVEASF